jgi:hypothetical protein
MRLYGVYPAAPRIVLSGHPEYPVVALALTEEVFSMSMRNAALLYLAGFALVVFLAIMASQTPVPHTTSITVKK